MRLDHLFSPGPPSGASRSRWLSCLILCGAVGLTIFSPGSVWSDAPTDDYNLAVGLYKQSRWPVAVERFEQFLKDYPTHAKAPFARLYLGLAAINQKDLATARDHFRLFVRDNPRNQNFALASYRIGECSYLLDDLKAARTELASYLESFPEDEYVERAMPFLGDVQLRLGESEAALKTFEESLAKFPKGPFVEDARFGRAKALEALNRTEEAIQQYQELAKDPQGSRAAEAQFQLAVKLFDARKFPESAAAYQDLVTRFPKSPLVATAQMNAAYAFYEARNYAEAATEFSKAAQVSETQRRMALYWRGLSEKQVGQFAEAIGSLNEALGVKGEQPTRVALEFQLGICERRQGLSSQARQRFLQIVKAVPKDEYADDSLFYAIELTLDSGDLPAAEPLFRQFQTEYPQSGLRLYLELLEGRWQLARANAAIKEGTSPVDPALQDLRQAAIEHFTHVIAESQLETLRAQARYYLGIAEFAQKKPDQALKAVTPLVAELLAGKTDPALSDAVILQSESYLALSQFEKAKQTAAEYERVFPQGNRLARAIALQALGAAYAGQTVEAVQQRDRLEQRFPKDAVTVTTTLELATHWEKLAKTREDWANVVTTYEKLVPLTAGHENQAFAFRGLAWAKYQHQDFAEASEWFSRVVQDYPQHPLAPECDYYRGEMLRQAGQLVKAAELLQETFERLAPATPPATGAEQAPPAAYAYLAGLQAARSLRSAEEVEAADKAYEALLTKFPAPQHLDRLLDEWARLNYDGERFSRSDEIFRRLLKDAPNSELADDARLSLAESDLIAGQLDKAEQEFQALFQAESSDPAVKERSLYQLLVVAIDRQSWKSVRERAGQFLQLFAQSPERPYAEYALVEATIAAPHSAEDLKNAQKILQSLQANSKEPLLANAVWLDRLWVLAAEVAFREKDYPGVAKAVQDLRVRSPQSKFLYQADEVLGRSEKQQARFDEARLAFERVLNDPNAFRTETAAKCQFLIAETWFLQERWHQAFLAYQKVYSSYKFPEWQSAALLQSGKCDEQQSQWKEAADTYAKLVAEFPQSSHVMEARQRMQAAAARIKT